MLVSRKILPFLARHTAINANKRVRERMAGYSKPFNIRQTRIQEIAGTCLKPAKSFDDFFASLFKPVLPSDRPLTPTNFTPDDLSPRGLASSVRANPPLQHETSATSNEDASSLLDGDESDEDSSVENSPSPPSADLPVNDARTPDEKTRKFPKIPKIQIPPPKPVSQYTSNVSSTTPPHSPFSTTPPISPRK